MRPLEVKLKEHKNNVKTGDTKYSKLAEDAWKHVSLGEPVAKQFRAWTLDL